MKRIITFIAFAAILCSCYPLTIVMNSTNSKGERTVLTSNQPLFTTSRGSFDVALGTRIAGRDTVIAVLITADTNDNHGIFNKDDKMMFKLSNGKVISLTNVYDKAFDTHTETDVTQTPRTDWGYAYSYSPWSDNIYVTPYAINRMVTRVSTRKINNSYALYLISRDQLWNIISNQVTKLRVEVEDNEYDMPNTDNVSSLFKDITDCLIGGVAVRRAKKEF